MKQIIDKNGKKPDPAESMTAPECQCPALGLANYYCVFVSNMLCLRASLNKLKQTIKKEN